MDNSFNVLSPVYTDGYILVNYVSDVQDNEHIISLYPNIVKINENINIKGLSTEEIIAVYDLNGKRINNYKLTINKIRFLQKGIFYLLIDRKIFKCLVI